MTTTPTPISDAWATADRYTRARSCHSLLVTLPPNWDVAAARQRLNLMAADWPALAGIRLWEAREPALVNGDPEARLATREASRPIGAAERPLRAVLVRGPGSGDRLVLVAIRSLVPTALLSSLASGLCGQSVPLASLAIMEERVPSQEISPPPWGLGEPGRADRAEKVRHVIESSARIGGRALRAAVTLVWSRYGPDEAAATGFAPRDHQTVSGYLSMFDKDATMEPAAVSVWYADPLPIGSYLPCLAPSSPMTVLAQALPDSSVAVDFWYDTGAVASEIATDFARQTIRAARELVSLAGDASLTDVGLLTGEESCDVLRLGGAGSSAPSSGSALGPVIHRRFAEVAAHRRDAVAVTDGRLTLTYAELEERAERIAQGLRALGVGAGEKVGIFLEQDASLIVALLAVLKCGCAYVPMDVRHPRERLRSTVSDAGVQVVICGGEFPEGSEARVTDMPELERLGKAADSGEAHGEADGSEAAYVIYTSGSTGHPKGTVVPHRNVVGLIDATKRDFALGADDVWTMFHSSAFDFSVWEMWGCLLTGGRLVMAPYWVTRSADDFHALLRTEEVTVLSQTPSAFSQLVMADEEASGYLSVRLVVFGGEPLDTRMLRPWLRRYPAASCRLVNMFGITETTVHVTSHTVTPREIVTGSRNVGRALPGWGVSVRDPRGRVLPPGAPGEIWVSGTGVASHYLGRPELTSQRFVTDPVSGQRCYRSGDLGRLRPDGSLDHLGRIDTQVKIRGHRIELGEIRSVLLREPSVSAAAVVVCQDVPDDPATARIHAYAVTRPGTILPEVLASVRERLPEYMVPSSLTAVGSLPLTANGKLDADRLPPPGIGAEPVKPPARVGDSQDHLTVQLLDLWRRHLGTQVGLDDNFFELGGNSLLVTRLLTDLRKRGFPRIAVVAFYRNSTARQFIELVRRETAEGLAKD